MKEKRKKEGKGRKRKRKRKEKKRKEVQAAYSEREFRRYGCRRKKYFVIRCLNRFGFSKNRNGLPTR